MRGPSRRGFLTGLLAASAYATPSWADLGNPAFLSAARAPSGQDSVVGLTPSGQEVFRQPLPGRGHAFCAHPTRPHVVAFARRPGRFAQVLDCRTGQCLAQMVPPDGHHFYGHGCFSQDGTRLFTTENDFQNARGVIGAWSVADGYRRIANYGSGGVGPHDMARLPDGSFVVANGGIETHPDTGRAKLNLATMRSNLSYLSEKGEITERMALSSEFRLNSIRHLDVASDGRVGFAMQWQGDFGRGLPLAGIHQRGSRARNLAPEDPRWRNLRGYGGSVAFDQSGQQLAVTSPRGGVLTLIDVPTDEILREHHLPDVCGVAALPVGWITTSGTGHITRITDRASVLQKSKVQWDNHLVPIT